ncbi:23S rRNA (guanosine-2'-O-)-methyltransferase RlmB [Methyloligella halotolerans]|uniref:23S rRNA (Guanosine-2'-O-)-methyltransferase RlmB n=1 Tax=Methyloligella halotolerans TaxID=1177755 RepID=A0A1E2S1C6_9HYPH|nr:23S rRNA (guanosine(2251)-2'-O)-methyltransferase RlmB [Methyloligella halotolerans]ODA68287.1 23S rRNA (guanosine-2'-O-)-methyltransferase RlmB [Methyloligella halotolerans]
MPPPPSKTPKRTRRDGAQARFAGGKRPRPGGRGGPRRDTGADGPHWLYGLHAVEAALRNDRREVHRALATPNAAKKLEDSLAARDLKIETVAPKHLDKLLGPDQVHQGIAIEVAPLPALDLGDLPDCSVVLILDQVTDPHNVGALLRSAAAFGAGALIMQERHSAPLNATLAKTASGALDLVPVILVRNLAQAMEALKERGYWLVGFAEEGADALETTAPRHPLGIVLGAEGRGLRELTRKTCDQLCRITTRDSLASLNVSNAGAIALHWAASQAETKS